MQLALNAMSSILYSVLICAHFPSISCLIMSLTGPSVNLDIKPDPARKHCFLPWKMRDFKRVVKKWQDFMINKDDWNALYLENHEQPRSVSRWGSDLSEYWEKCAKMLAIFLGFLKGTLFVYQGQELGMINIPHDHPITEYPNLETRRAVAKSFALSQLLVVDG